MKTETKTEAEPQPWELGKNRIEALSDGIFAIAMTLLVLNFHIPNLPRDASNIRVLPALLQMWPSFATYVVSFLSLASSGSATIICTMPCAARIGRCSG